MDYLQKILEDYKHLNFEKGVFCDSLILRDITGKSEHYNVIRDIRNVVKTLCETLGVEAIGTINFDPFDLEKDLLSQAKEQTIALNFEGSEFQHFRISTYKDSSGKENVRFELSEKAYLTMMGYYSDYITLQLYRFYARVTHARQVTVQQLARLNHNELEDLSSLLNIVKDIEGSTDKFETERLKSVLNEKCEEYTEKYENYFEMDVMLAIAANKTVLRRRGRDVYATVGDIASITQKRSDNIIRDIDTIIKNILKVDPKIYIKDIYKEEYYTTSKNKEARTYSMSEEGFVILMCHYNVSLIWMLASFYVEMKKLLVPKVQELLTANAEMVYDAIQYVHACDEFLIQICNINTNKGEKYVEHKSEGIIEQLNAFRATREQDLLNKWDPNRKFSDNNMRFDAPVYL
nr:MAG TPA: regulatory protein [Caudoviricetes sp.]